MEYKVTVVRIEHRVQTFKVNADSKWEAEEKGLEISYDYDFSKNRSIYKKEEVIRVCQSLVSN